MLTRAVERAAVALGVWRDEPDTPDVGPLALVPLLDSRLRVESSGPLTDIDALTAALLLLGHARGLRLDLGECPACRERGSKRGLARWDSAERYAVLASRPCPACTVDGKPTGRESLDWATALVVAIPWVGGRDVHERARRMGRTVSALHHDTREALGVLADQMQTSTDPDWEHTHPFGLWLATWLSGASCPACGGNGRYHPMPTWSGSSSSFDPSRECDRCHGHGSALGMHAPEIAAELDQNTVDMH